MANNVIYRVFLVFGSLFQSLFSDKLRITITFNDYLWKPKFAAIWWTLFRVNSIRTLLYYKAKFETPKRWLLKASDRYSEVAVPPGLTVSF
jgi:hypothetical protein